MLTQRKTPGFSLLPVFFPFILPLRADNKFSSFVRQLNFYGFRKVKSNITVEGHDTKWWEFKVCCVMHVCCFS